ncbi:MAG: AMP-binding protein [Acidimicrobiales bacterium]
MDLLTAHAQATPDKVAVVDDRPGQEPRQMTFAEFNACANRLANGIVDAGIDAGAKVMWLGQNSLEVFAFYHAARKASTISVPLNYRLSDPESVYVINNSDSELIFADVEFAPLLARIRGEIPAVKQVVIFGGEPLEGQISQDDFFGSDAEVDRDQAAAGTMIYTSGTTGNPKGAVRHATSSPEQGAGLLNLIGYGPGDVYITCGPLYHSGPGGFAGIAHTLGNTVVLQHKFDPEDWLRLIDTYKASSTFSAPTPIRMVVNLPDEVKAKYDTSSMKIMIANAAPWPHPLKEAYIKDFPPESLWEVYGSTEMGVNTVLAPEDQMRKPGSCGKPAPFVEVALFDDDGNTIDEPNVPGELFVRASSVFDTYYKAEEKYAADDRDGWHTVGDIAYRDDEGYLFICDRKKDMIISGGMNIYPAEIEAALEKHEGIYEVAVIGVESEQWGETVMAIVVPNGPGPDGKVIDVEEIDRYARQQLASYKVPRIIELIDEIPKTGSNKILKRELRERFADVKG